ncbi:MAG: YHYH protein [Lentimonas sp.]
MQNYIFEVPTKAKVAKEPTPMIRHPFGIVVNGVLFDPGTAEYYQRDRRSEWNYEALSSGTSHLGLDKNHAHAQPNGAYHYHGIPTALVEALEKNANR